MTSRQQGDETPPARKTSRFAPACGYKHRETCEALAAANHESGGADQTGSGAVLSSVRVRPPDFRVAIARRSQTKAGEAEVGLSVEVGGGRGRRARAEGEGAAGKAERSLLKATGVLRRAVPGNAREKTFPRRLGEGESFFVLIGNVDAG